MSNTYVDPYAEQLLFSCKKSLFIGENVIFLFDSFTRTCDSANHRIGSQLKIFKKQKDRFGRWALVYGILAG